MEQPASAGEADESADQKLIARLITRIAELEKRLYDAEFSEEKEVQPTIQARPEPLPEAPKLGFLSAIRAGLRQLEESTGYTTPTLPPPTPSQQPSPAPQPGQTRIVYYQTPPKEIVNQLQANQGVQLHVETSHASSSSVATTASAADWISSRLGWGAKPSSPRETPKEGSTQQQQGSMFFAPSTLDVSTSSPDRDLSTTSLRPVASEGNLHTSTSFSGNPAGAGELSRFREGLTAATPSGRSFAEGSGGGKAGASDWFSSFFKRERESFQQQAQQQQVQQKQQQLTQQQPPGQGVGPSSVLGVSDVAGPPGQQQDGSYYRYVFDPADVAAEMEVTARVRKVAAEALMQAEDKLRAAEQAQAAMLEQLEQSKELAKEMEELRRANEQALATRAALEDEIISSRAALEATKTAQESLQEELEGLRTQATIWQGATSDEKDKLTQENTLLRNQMQKRLNELQVVKSKLTEAEAERQRHTRDMEELTGKLQWLTKINKQLETSAQQLEAHRKLAAEIQDKFIKERAVRRRLHEQLQQLRGNIRVMCRVRPCLPNQTSIITYPLEGLLGINPPDRRPQDFEFDHVFGPDAQQQAIYEEVSPLVRSCADGYNVCIFAYGQTGSGKTFTMEGVEDQPGINVRALQELFSIGSEEGIELNWKVQVSMLEVYNDTLHDLLLPAGEVAPRSLDVSGLGAGELPPGAERVPNATWRPVNSLDDVRQVLREGSKNRSTAATALNAHSSRSHAVLSVRVTAHASNMTLRSTIHLVDLAGSERVDKSEVTGQQLKEAQSINKSLSALGDVISALQRRTPHIPFRNSKLTQVLQDSLCGSSKVLLVCNISPEGNSASETLSSLNFASRAAQVELGQARKATEKVITAADRMPAQHPASVTSGGGAAVLLSPERPSKGTPISSRDGMKSVRSSQNMGRVGGGAGSARESSNGSARDSARDRDSAH